MHRLIVCFFWLGGLNAAAAAGETPLWKARMELDAEYRRNLETIAAKCDALGMEPQARLTRDWFIERDSGRQYLFIPGSVRESPTSGEATDLVQKWRAKLTSIRHAQAEKLIELAGRQLAGGDATSAYQLLHEVLHEDPGHTEARRILGIGDGGAPRPRSRIARLVHPQFGWARGRWWQIESPHFQIATNQSAEAGLALARRLELVRAIWAQVCFEYWSNAATLKDDFAGRAIRPTSRRRHQVVLFRDRQNYIDQLEQAQPQIGLTLGYYHKANQTSYFHAGDESLVSVWNHEATHQLFQETGEPIRDVAEHANFWAVEGVAVYFESLSDHGAFFTVGGFDADRLQFVRSRVLGGESQMPLTELVRLGREALQQHPDIRRLYTQSAGLTHFFFDFDRGRYRDRFVQFLAAIYAGVDTPDSLHSMLGLSQPVVEEDWKEFLAVTSNDLKYLGPAEQRRNLSLLRGDIDDAALLLLAGDRQLEWLDLSFTPITADALNHLAGLGSLTRLTLVGVRIGDEAAASLSKLAGLEELDLSGTAITDRTLQQLARLGRLKVLRLSHTAVTDGGISQLSGLDQLEELDVDETMVTAAGLAALKNRLPKLGR